MSGSGETSRGAGVDEMAGEVWTRPRVVIYWDGYGYRGGAVRLGHQRGGGGGGDVGIGRVEENRDGN